MSKTETLEIPHFSSEFPPLFESAADMLNHCVRGTDEDSDLWNQRVKDVIGLFSELENKEPVQVDYYGIPGTSPDMPFIMFERAIPTGIQLRPASEGIRESWVVSVIGEINGTTLGHTLDLGEPYHFSPAQEGKDDSRS